MKWLAAVLLFLAPACVEAQALPAAHHGAVARFFDGYRHQLKQQFVDVKRHPVAWGIPFVLKVAINFSDTGSTCVALGPNVYEGNPLIGRHPSCHKLVLLDNLLTFGAEQPLTHYLSDRWTERCYKDAADPNSRWNNIDAGSHNPESCRWNVPYGLLLPEAYHVEVVISNIHLAKE